MVNKLGNLITIVNIGNLITIICLLVMAGWFLLSRKKFLEEIKREPFEEYDEPGTATGLGILGTFIGITYGLCFFDTSHVITSVPNLLTGLKMAFFTSIFGMGMSMYLKWEQHKQQDKCTSKQQAGVPALLVYLRKRDEQLAQHEQKREELQKAQMANQLHYLRESYESLGKNLTKSVSLMTQSIIGDGEHTMNSELKRGFAAVCEENKALAQTLENFKMKILREQQKQFTTAMNLVVTNFNENLSQQFGENFQSFNEAVHRLLDWQEAYEAKLKTVSDQQEEVTRHLDAVGASVENVRQSVEGMGSAAQSLHQASDAIRQDSDIIQKGMQEMVVSLQSFKDVSPMMEHISQELVSTSQMLEQMAMSQQEALKQIVEREVENLCRQLKARNGEAAEAMNRELIQSAKETNDSIKQIAAKMTEDLNQRVNETLLSLGHALAQVSEKFVSDYTPLAEKLEEVVLLANTLQSELQQQKPSPVYADDAHAAGMSDNGGRSISNADAARETEFFTGTSTYNGKMQTPSAYDGKTQSPLQAEKQEVQ